METTLLERADQVGRLLDAVGEAAGGRGSAVLISGEAGIGKSSIVSAFTGQVGSGVRVLSGACDDLLAPQPLGPLREAARGSAGPLEQALGRSAADDVFAAVSAELDGPRPTVLVVEDVHWADDATLDVLRYVARRIDGLRAVLVLTFRAEGMDARHPLRPLLSAFATSTVRRLELEPLSVAAVASLAAGSGWDPAELHHLTGGNPFYVTEALAGPGGVPVTVVDAALARLQDLDADCAGLVEQLSVLPAPAGMPFVDALLGDRVVALAEAERRGILVVRHGQVGFRHEIARRAVEQSMPAIRRRTLHQNVVRLMLDRPDPDLPALVHHAAGAGDVDTMLRYAPRVAREATSAGSHRQALTAFEAVLPVAGRLDTAERAALYDDYAWELHIASRFVDAVRVGGEAVALRERASDPEPLAETLLRQSRHLLMSGDLGAARVAVERAIRLAESIGSASARAATATYRGVIMVNAGEVADAVPALAAAYDAALAAGRPDLAATGRCYAGIARCLLGDLDGLADMRASIELAVAHGQYEAAARAYTNFAEVTYRLHRWPDLGGHLDRGLELATERGYWSHVRNLEVHRALLDLRHGDWDVAERRLRQLVDSADDPSLLGTYCNSALGRLLARHADPRAAGVLAATWEQALAMRSVPGLADAATAYLEWAWLNDRPDVAAAVQDRLVREFPLAVTPVMTELRRYLVRAGIEVAAPGGHPEPYDGFVAGARGDWRTAAGLWEQAGAPYERALELAESDDGATLLTALRILDELGAVAAATILRRRMRGLGVRGIPRRVPGRLRGNPAGLSDRQLQVLKLLTEGLTNPQIADRLVLSVRTVDHHVAAILGKLGASDRREAAAAARALGIE